MTLTLETFSKQYKEQIDRMIEQELERRIKEVAHLSPHLTPIITAMQELSVGGKRLRGLLTILGYQMSKQQTAYSEQEEQEIIKAATVMELFHLGLMIQDDVMDRDSLRRGVATIHTRYDDLHLGESIATLAGDFTFGWGIEILANLNSPITNSQITNAMRVWGRHFGRVGYGQALDMLQVADEDSLIQILSLKSGEYSCVLPLVLGATLGGGKPGLVKQLTEYGMELGWVFQLRDDYLAEWGESNKTGKPVGNDRREGKHSFAMLYGRDKLVTAIQEHANKAKQAIDVPVLHEIVDWIKNREN